MLQALKQHKLTQMIMLKNSMTLPEIFPKNLILNISILTLCLLEIRL